MRLLYKKLIAKKVKIYNKKTQPIKNTLDELDDRPKLISIKNKNNKQKKTENLDPDYSTESVSSSESSDEMPEQPVSSNSRATNVVDSKLTPNVSIKQKRTKTKKRKTAKRYAACWNHFKIIKKNGIEYSCCQIEVDGRSCNKLYKLNSSTSRMNRHLVEFHKVNNIKCTIIIIIFCEQQNFI